MSADPRADVPVAGERVPFTVRVVDRFGEALGGAGLSRRRFLGRAAIVASALTVNPLQYVLRPLPAYASLCGDAASCSGGWTAFCCTVNDGANTCPQGSFAAGWWKIDSSPFCRDDPRYIVDCNRSPGASCSCRCADDPCDTRRVCCNNFRYGQCNTQIDGVTEIVCRVVTCAPPWEWDPACGRTARTDNRTRSHNSRCLPGRYPSHIEMHYQDLGLVGSVLGAPTTPERDAAHGGRYRRFDHGSIYWSAATGAQALRGAIDWRYRELGGTAGPLRYPRTEHRRISDDGEMVRFERGTIYFFEGIGARGVTGRSDGRYRQLGTQDGVLGRPTSSTGDSERGWRVTNFEEGRIHESPGGHAAELHGPVLAHHEELGGIGGSGLGHAVGRPRTRSGVIDQRFEHGVIAGPDDGQVHAVRGPIAERYVELDLAAGPWGVPVADQVAVESTDGEMVEFAEVTVYASPGTGVRALTGPVLERYLDEDGPRGDLGFPTSDLFTDRFGQQRATFEHGAIAFDPAAGSSRVLHARTTRSRDQLPAGSGDTPARRTTRSADDLPAR